MCLEQEARAVARNIMFAETLDRDLMRQMFKYVFECTSCLNGALASKDRFQWESTFDLNMSHPQSTRHHVNIMHLNNFKQLYEICH